MSRVLAACAVVAVLAAHDGICAEAPVEAATQTAAAGEPGAGVAATPAAVEPGANAGAAAGAAAGEAGSAAAPDAAASGEASSPEIAAPAPPPPPPPPPITLVLKTDLTHQRLTVVVHGKIAHVWPISSGRRGYATKTGTFRPQWAARMWYSRQYDLSPMPHAVFFNRGTAFHGTSAVRYLGRPASHGCVRLAPANAAKLYALVHRHGYASTKVIVHGQPRFEEPVVAERAARRRIANERARSRERAVRYGPRNPWRSFASDWPPGFFR